MEENKNKRQLQENEIRKLLKNNMGILLVLFIICFLVTIATDKFLTYSNIISVLRQISINMYIALGMTLVIILGHIDLSVGSIVAMSGTLTVGFIVNQNIPIWLSIVLGLILGT